MVDAAADRRRTGLGAQPEQRAMAAEGAGEKP